MWTYYWYLVKKESLQLKTDDLNDWVLVCPDFPNHIIEHPKLNAKQAMDHWNTGPIIALARDITEEQINEKLRRGDTIPSPQKELPGYFSFKIEVGYSEGDFSS